MARYVPRLPPHLNSRVQNLDMADYMTQSRTCCISVVTMPTRWHVQRMTFDAKKRTLPWESVNGLIFYFLSSSIAASMERIRARTTESVF